MSISKKPIKVEYVSMLAEAQKAVQTGAIERMLQVAGNTAAVNPEILDNINFDRTMNKYGSLLSVDPEIMNTRNEVLAIRKARTEQNQVNEAAAATPGAAAAAKNLSETDVGGGKNALQAILGTESVAA